MIKMNKLTEKEKANMTLEELNAYNDEKTRIHIYLTNGEKEKIKKHSSFAGFSSVSEYIRYAAFEIIKSDDYIRRVKKFRGGYF